MVDEHNHRKYKQRLVHTEGKVDIYQCTGCHKYQTLHKDMHRVTINPHFKGDQKIISAVNIGLKEDVERLNEPCIKEMRYVKGRFLRGEEITELIDRQFKGSYSPFDDKEECDNG